MIVVFVVKQRSSRVAVKCSGRFGGGNDRPCSSSMRVQRACTCSPAKPATAARIMEPLLVAFVTQLQDATLTVDRYDRLFLFLSLFFFLFAIAGAR